MKGRFLYPGGGGWYSTWLVNLVVKAVAHAAHGRDEALVAQFVADVADVYVHHAHLTVVIVPPHALEQLFAAEHLAALFGQGPEQVEFDSGQLDELIVHPHVAAAGVNPYKPAGQHAPSRQTAPP